MFGRCLQVSDAPRRPTRVDSVPRRLVAGPFCNKHSSQPFGSRVRKIGPARPQIPPVQAVVPAIGAPLTAPILAGALTLLSLLASLATWVVSRKDDAQLPPLLRNGPWWQPQIISNTLYLADPPSAAQALEDGKASGGAVRLTTLLGDLVFMSGADAVRWVWQSDNSLEMQSPFYWKSLLGEHMIFFKTGADHKRLRTTLANAFTPAALAACTPLLQRAAQTFLTDLAERTSHNNSTHVDVYPLVKKLTMNMALVTMLGKSLDEDPRLAQLFNDFGTWLLGLGTVVPFDLPFNKYGRALRARGRILATLRLFLEERRAPARGGGALQEDTLGRLMSARHDDGSALSDDEILDAMLGFIFAGDDTVASSICSAFYVLTHEASLECVEKLRAEVAAAYPTPDAPIAHDALEKLPYLDAFTKELLRTFPAVREAMRTVTQPVEYKCPFAAAAASLSAAAPASPSPEAYSFPPKTDLIVNFYNSANDPQFFADPERFEPERFLPGREEHKVAPYAYAPWGFGARKCLGRALATLEVKMLLVQLVRDYDVSVATFQKSVYPIAVVRPTVRLQRRDASPPNAAY